MTKPLERRRNLGCLADIGSLQLLRQSMELQQVAGVQVAILEQGGRAAKWTSAVESTVCSMISPPFIHASLMTLSGTRGTRHQVTESLHRRQIVRDTIALPKPFQLLETTSHLFLCAFFISTPGLGNGRYRMFMTAFMGQDLIFSG